MTVAVSIPNVQVSLVANLSLVSSTLYFPFGGESLVGVQVSLSTSGSAPPSGNAGILDFTRGTSAVYIAMFGGFP